MKGHDFVAALRKSILFQNLSKEALEDVALKASFQQFSANETIVWQGRPSDSLYLITNGIVTVKKIAGGKEHILAYLMPGLTFGEVGILENQPRSASVTALCEVEVLVISRSDFLHLLHTYPSVAVELAKMLGRYLVETSRRQALGNKDARLILLFNLAEGSGSTSIGSLLAMSLANQTTQPTVYLEYPNPQNLSGALGIRNGTKTYRHPSGFDILVSQEEHLLPASARTTLMLDQILNAYNNIVIGLKDFLDDTIGMMLDYAKEIIIVIPPETAIWEKATGLEKELRKRIRPNDTNLFVVVNRSRPEHDGMAFPFPFDFEIPYIASFPSLASLVKSGKAPEGPLKAFVDIMVQRIEKTQQICIYVPTTFGTDLITDTSHYVEKTLSFLGKRFGGATSKEAQGVWNSQKSGLVGEKVFLVNTYATQGELNKYLDEVVEFIELLKRELNQEAMALEVNQKLTLI